MSSRSLREDALAIWRAGVAAVDSTRLVLDHVSVDQGMLYLADEAIDLNEIRRILVVGAGKAGAGMSTGLEQALGDQWMTEKGLQGWVNVPDDCVRPLSHIHLHGARPSGMNEPTEAGITGTRQILEIVRSAEPDDLCLCLISGGGSALLPAPIPQISLADKLAITKHLSAAGANIQELNTVRKQLSSVKGGGLAHACKAGRMVTLIISDVIGDPLDVIGSGPTVTDASTAEDAIEVLDRFHSREAGVPSHIYDVLRSTNRQQPLPNRTCDVRHLVIGNNATAVDAAGLEAERRGYSHAMTAATTLEGPAEDVGRHLGKMALQMRSQQEPDCLITGGEPTVKLVDPPERGKGGRNQQLVLAALDFLISQTHHGQPRAQMLEGMALLAGGTDGEDGPTDAAGAFIDEEVVKRMEQERIEPAEFLRRNDAYHFFEALNALLRTGPTHTNVCDLRVVTVSS